jgi:hypothetical protein
VTGLRSVQRAALERAVLDPDRTRHHLAFAAALEPARETTSSGPETDRGPVAVALVATAAATALLDRPSRGDPSPESASRTVDPWRPRAERPPDRLVVDGAVLACRVLDVSPERVASLAAVSPDAVRNALDNQSPDA